MRRLRHLFIVALVVLGLSGPIPGTVGSAGAQGSAGAPNQKVVVLGDSIAFGLWDLRGGYARRYADLVGADLVKIAWPGWTIADLSAALDQPWVRQAVSSADIVVFDIGANDLAALREAYKSGDCDSIDPGEVNDVAAEWKNVSKKIHDLTAEPVLSFNLYNPFVDQDRNVDTCTGDVGDVGDDLANLNQALLDFNKMIALDGVAVADVYTSFNIWRGQLIDPARKWYLAFDDFHPNFRGHAEIASLLAELTP